MPDYIFELDGASHKITANTPEEARAKAYELQGEDVPDSGKDIAKSMGTAALHGVAAIPALPRSMADLIGGSAAWLADRAESKWTGEDYTKVRARQEARREKEGYYTSTHVLPSQEDINTKVSETAKKLGVRPDLTELHKPQGEWAKLAYNVIEPIPGAIALGPGTFAAGRGAASLGGAAWQTGKQVGSNALLYGALPGASSDLTGRAFKGLLGPDAETAGKVIGGLLGGGAGALIQRPASSVATLKENVPKELTRADVTAAKDLIDKARTGGVTLTWPMAIKQVTGDTVDLTNLQRQLETISGSRGQLQKIAGELPGQVEAMVKKVVPGSIKGNVREPYAAGLAAQAEAKGRLKDINTDINVASRPHYQAVGHTQIDPADYARLQADPIFQKAEALLQKSPERMKLINDNGYAPDSVGYFNEVKQIGDDLTKRFGKKTGRGPETGVWNTLTKDVRQTAINASPRYGRVLEAQETLRARELAPRQAGPLGQISKTNNLNRMGERAMPTANELMEGQANVSSDLVKQFLERDRSVTARTGQVSRAGETAVRQIIQNHIMRSFNKSMKGPDKAWAGSKFIGRLFGTTAERQNAEALLRALPNGDTVWEGISQMIPILEATGKRMRPGSPAGQNIRNLEELGQGTVVGGPSTVTFPIPVYSRARDLLSSWRLKKNAEGLARLIASPDSAALFAQLVKARGLDKVRQVLNIMNIASSSDAEKGVVPGLPPKDDRDVYGRP